MHACVQPAVPTSTDKLLTCLGVPASQRSLGFAAYARARSFARWLSSLMHPSCASSAGSARVQLREPRSRSLKVTRSQSSSVQPSLTARCWSCVAPGRPIVDRAVPQVRAACSSQHGDQAAAATSRVAKAGCRCRRRCQETETGTRCRWQQSKSSVKNLLFTLRMCPEHNTKAAKHSSALTRVDARKRTSYIQPRSPPRTRITETV